MTALPGQGQVAEEGRRVQSPAAQTMTATQAMMAAQPAARPRWADDVLWRRRALRLLGVWALLSVVLVGLRVSTAAIRPELRDAQTTQAELVKQRDALSLEVQSLGSANRISAWAEEAGMLRFADSLKRSAELSGVEAPTPPAPPPPLKLRWQWGPGPATPEDSSPEKQVSP